MSSPSQDLYFWYLFHGGLEARQLQDCAEAVEEALAHRCASFEEWLDVQVRQMPDKDAHGFLEQHHEQFMRLSEQFPETIRRSLFVTGFSHLEHALNQLCSTLQASMGLRAGVKDIAGNGISRAQTYLKKVAQVEFPDQSPEWTEVMHLQAVRNALVHRSGEIGDDKKFRSWVEQHPDLVRVAPGDAVALQEDFMPYALGLIRTFLDMVYGLVRRQE